LEIASGRGTIKSKKSSGANAHRNTCHPNAAKVAPEIAKTSDESSTKS
jgi:hypothetical protein